MSKNKQPSISMFKKEVESYEEFIETDIQPVGHDVMTLRIYPFFKPEKVSELVKELYDCIALFNKDKVELTQSEESDFINYFIIKHFTNLKATRSKKAKVIYDEFKLLINASIYTSIMEVLPKESIESVYKMVYDVRDASLELEAQVDKIKKEYADLKLENKDIIEDVLKNRNLGIRNSVIEEKINEVIN